jgi:hypothetical protein
LIETRSRANRRAGGAKPSARFLFPGRRRPRGAVGRKKRLKNSAMDAYRT